MKETANYGGTEVEREASPYANLKRPGAPSCSRAWTKPEMLEAVVGAGSAAGMFLLSCDWMCVSGGRLTFRVRQRRGPKPMAFFGKTSR